MKLILVLIAVFSLYNSPAFAQSSKKEYAPLTEDPFKSETPGLLDCVKTSIRKFISANNANSTVKLDLELDETPLNPFLNNQKSCTKLGCDDLIQGTEGANFKVKANVIHNKTKVQKNYLGCANMYIAPSKNATTGQIEKYICTINVDFDHLETLDYKNAKQMLANFNQVLDAKQITAKLTPKQFGNVNYKCGK